MEQSRKLSPDEEAFYVALQQLDILIGTASMPVREGVKLADALGQVARTADKLLHTKAADQLKERRLQAVEDANPLEEEKPPTVQ